jgi:hypothetical protein
MTLTEKHRQSAVKRAQFLINYAGQIGYEYGGGLTGGWMDQSEAGMKIRFDAGEIWEPDCRAAVLWICKWSGWRSPTGIKWAGSSGEMWEHLPHLTGVQEAQVGTLVTYGAGGDDHVCMVMQPDGDDPWLFSHGSAAGPLHIRLSEESAAHDGQPVTFLAVSAL